MDIDLNLYGMSSVCSYDKWLGRVVLVTVLLLIGIASPAFGAPVHLPAPPLDISGFNKACGATVDSKGDLYVSSAGDAKVNVYDPEHKLLTSIEDTNEPCGLAVDNKGNLYAVESKTGDAVRFSPNVYPFAGNPLYGAPTTIDASGEAKGVTVDPTDDRLYVAEGTRVAVYTSNGVLYQTTEVQNVEVYSGTTGGTYTLSFKGQTTGSLPYLAGHSEVQVALEGLSTIGAGNVSVSDGEGVSHDVTFTGSLNHANVEQITCDESGLEGVSPACKTSTKSDGFGGSFGEGNFTDTTSVSVYTSPFTSEKSNHYVFAADSASNEVKIFGGPDVRSLKLRGTIDGSQTPAGRFGFGPAGAGLATDPGNERYAGSCIQVAEQACTAGHLFVYDDLHGVVDEFDASGQYLTSIKLTETAPSFADAHPTAIAVDRSGESNDGTVYVTTGSGLGAELIAFGPLAAPSRPSLPALSRVLEKAQAVATDSVGDVYVAAATKVYVYDPAGVEITQLEDKQSPEDLAVDSTGKLYVVDYNDQHQNVTYYTPSVYPPVHGTVYERHEPSVANGSFASMSIAINPSSDHVFVAGGEHMIELDSAAHGSAILNPNFGGRPFPPIESIAVYGGNGDVYISVHEGKIFIVDSTGTEILAQITGSGSPEGPLLERGAVNPQIAIDQSNGHLLAFEHSGGAVEEFDASGAFIAEFGKFTKDVVKRFDIAVDSSGGASNGNVYTAFDDPAPGSFDVTAFGPLAYGEPPSAVTGSANGFTSGGARLNGTVDPRGFDLELCRFEYTTETDFQANGFTGAEQAECVPNAIGVGKGFGAVAVHADVSGLDLAERYEFRVIAENKYGPSQGNAVLFGAPVIGSRAARPVSFDEATLRATVDPSGLATKYHFEYGESEGYGQSTSSVETSTGVDVGMVATGLTVGTTYHYRLIAENEAGKVDGQDEAFTTLTRRAVDACPNAEYRTGFSANLPDCRAYELVTPAQTGGLKPGGAAGASVGADFNNWLSPPRGASAGERVSYFTYGTLPGFDGTGVFDGYRAQRTEGAHPLSGWTSEMFGPTYVQSGGHRITGGSSGQLGVASDELYSFWKILPPDVLEGGLTAGIYLRTPTGFEILGQGNLGTDPNAESEYVSGGGTHVIFGSKEHLEAEAAPVGANAIYDRAAGAAIATVVSVKPDGSPFAGGENATYIGASEDGSAVAFKVGGVLYLHRDGETFEIAAAPNTFGGISEDGKRVFYAATTDGEKPAGLFVCDTRAGSCVGGEAHSPVEIAGESVFVAVSSDGSHVYFYSHEAHGEGAIAGQDNLYAWDGAATDFIAILDSHDLTSFAGGQLTRLDRWTSVIGRSSRPSGRADAPVRSVPDGSVFVFQSHAHLTQYQNNGFGEIYRYDSAAADKRVTCVSCDQTGGSPSADAMLEGPGAPIQETTMISNVTDDGQVVFFQSKDRLVPEDANKANDVYEWKADGADGCERGDGCLALISSGQDESESNLYSMSVDGHDVFFATVEKLVGADVPGSSSIYDARVDGGIPDPSEKAACEGDACQGQPSPPPLLSIPASVAAGSGNVVTGKQSPRSQRSLSRVQLLARALKACRHRPKHKRHGCEKQARKRYGVKKASKSLTGRAGR